MNEGLIWMVGNGHFINIWKDKWINRPPLYKILSPVAILQPNATVNELICTETCSWKMDLIQDIFSNEEISLISSIPLTLSGREDQLVWSQTKPGLFNVKSAYYLHKNILAINDAEPSLVAGTEMFYGMIFGNSKSQMEL